MAATRLKTMCHCYDQVAVVKILVRFRSADIICSLSVKFEELSAGSIMEKINDAHPGKSEVRLLAL